YKSPSISDLRGCVNDAKAMAAFLRARLGVPADHMRVLLSETEDAPPETLPTRANILAGWEWLLSQAESGDQVFFHYSGHGSQAPTVDPPSEPDGYDETLVPYDSRETGPDGQPVYDILDKELKTYIDLVEAKGALVTVFLDCCHSGSGTRDPDVPVRKTRADERPRPLETVEPRTAARLAQPLARSASPSGWELGADGHVLLAGCRDEELSHEYRDPNTGAWHGATTFFFLQSLRNFDPALTWREVYEQVRMKVNGVYQNQTPQLEGPDNRRIFGEWAPPTAPHLLVEKVEQDAQGVYVYINGGPPLGLTEGSRVEIYPPGSGDMSGAPLARGVVDMVEVDHVWATVTAPPAQGEIPVLARVKIAAQSYDNLVYPVAVTDPLVQKVLRSPKEEGGDPEQGFSPFLQVLEEGAAGAFFQVEARDDHYAVLDAAGVQIVSETPPRTTEGARQVARILEHLAIYNNVRNLRNPSPMPLLADAVTVEAFSYTRAGRTRPTDGIPLDQRDAVLEPGRMVWLTVRNDSAEDLYASVFVLTSDFGIKRIYPRRAAYQKVEAGGAFFVNRLRPRINNPFVGRSPAIFKVFVT
ncbi:MAG: caspase family protein, partial [Caldilineae bacterium]